MYIPGRFRTASRPSSLSIFVASYRSVLAVFFGTFFLSNRIQNGVDGYPRLRSITVLPVNEDLYQKTTSLYNP
ncbi:MAG: hypothetical protein Ct9H300mP32_0200 [Verrucomicrobiota bacterium]|nr:MAG: hypothetical protein Ct9H300mP32_0200 [Verrucomicrobiota bacterium]